MEVETVLDALTAAGLGLGNADADYIKSVLDDFTEEEWDRIWKYSELHQIWSVIWRGINLYSIQCVPDELRWKFENAEKSVAYQYYTMLSFSTYVLQILQNAGINCYLLKGIALNMLYPKEDMRKLSDVDIYISDREEFIRADQILKDNGFRFENTDTQYHNEYLKLFGEKICVVEIHGNICDRFPDTLTNKRVSELYNNLAYEPEYIKIADADIPILPLAENALELLLHMLQHYLHGGFGMKLICDWAVFWKKKSDEVDQERYLQCLEITGLKGFAWAVTALAIRHVGLDEKYVTWMHKIYKEKYVKCPDMLFQDIIESGEFAKGRPVRFVILGHDTSRLGAYVKEVHEMMKVRFPKLKKVLVIWPLLWAATIIVFLYNNRRLNRGKTLEVIKGMQKRHMLLQQIEVLGEKEKRK